LLLIPPVAIEKRRHLPIPSYGRRAFNVESRAGQVLKIGQSRREVNENFSYFDRFGVL
jgi:hypothetical protein